MDPYVIFWNIHRILSININLIGGKLLFLHKYYHLDILLVSFFKQNILELYFRKITEIYLSPLSCRRKHDYTDFSLQVFAWNSES